MSVAHDNHVQNESEIRHSMSVMTDSNCKEQSSGVKVSSISNDLRTGNKSNESGQIEKSNQSQINKRSNENDSVANRSQDLPISTKRESRNMPHDPITDNQPSETTKQRRYTFIIEMHLSFFNPQTRNRILTYNQNQQPENPNVFDIYAVQYRWQLPLFVRGMIVLQ